MPSLVAVALAVASTIVASIGMVLFKQASKLEIRKMFFSRFFISGGILFVLGTVMFILALKLDKLSTLFSLTSLTYVWVMTLSKIYLKEKINKWKILATLFITMGIILAVQ